MMLFWNLAIFKLIKRSNNNNIYNLSNKKLILLNQLVTNYNIFIAELKKLGEVVNYLVFAIQNSTELVRNPSNGPFLHSYGLNCFLWLLS